MGQDQSAADRRSGAERRGGGRTLHGFLTSEACEVPLEGGRVRIVFTHLPGRNIAVAARDEDGVLWIVCDEAKSWGRGQMLALLHEAPSGFCHDICPTWYSEPDPDLPPALPNLLMYVGEGQLSA